VLEQPERRVQDNLSLMQRYFDLLDTQDLDDLAEPPIPASRTASEHPSRPAAAVQISGQPSARLSRHSPNETPGDSGDGVGV
jgi:hypothetical protein